MALRYDQWPCEVYIPSSGLFREARVQITSDSHLVVWQNVTGVAKPVLIRKLSEPDEFAIPRRGNPLQASVVGENDPILINKTGGCACGNPIRNLIEADALAAVAQVTT